MAPFHQDSIAFEKDIVVHRSAQIEILELRLFDFLSAVMPAADAMRVTIGYFDKTEKGVLNHLMDMPKGFWIEEVAEIQQRLSEPKK
jgi:hypothetical protein